MSQVFWERLLAAAKAPFESLVSPQSSFNLLFLLLTLVFCAAIYARHARRPLRLRTLRRFLLPRRIYLHPSAKLDYKYYVIAAALRAGMLGSMVLSSNLVATGVIATLTGTFGAFVPIAAPLYVILPVATIAQVVLFDLGYWIAHRTMHEIPLLWEFHKTHHAAEVLTPVTSARSHPVDDLIQTNCIAAMLGLGYGVLVYAFGKVAQPVTLLETNVIFFVYSSRSSICVTAISGCQSAAGSATSSKARAPSHPSQLGAGHLGKNLGFCLSCGIGRSARSTSRISAKAGFGLGHESAEFASVKDLLLRPFHKAARLFAFRAKPAPVVAEHET